MIFKNIKKILSPKRVKVALQNFMILSGVFYITELKPIFNLDSILKEPDFRSWMLIKIALIYSIIYFVFYKLLKYALRYLFHAKLRDLIRKERDEFLIKVSTEDKRSFSVFTEDISEMIFKYFIKMGLITSNDLSTPLKINKTDKEDLFNEILLDQYSWILLVFHSLVTTIVVFKFYSWWFILLMILVILVLMFFVFVMIYILLHMDVLEPIRKKLLRKSSQLM